MKNLFLIFAVAISSIFVAPMTAEAGCCDKKNCETVVTEICRRCFTRTECVCGCHKVITYIEVTYQSINCCGKTKTWTKTYRA